MMYRRWFGFLAILMATALPAAAQSPSPDGSGWKHGLSLMGDVKYPEGFKHFDYVNPDAPKGGRVRLSAIGTFDSFNPFIVTGNPAAGVALLYDTLMAPSFDEASSEYGLIADAARYPEDYSSVTFRLRPEARWHDGKPITTEDVIWSFETLKKIFPTFNRYYQNVVKAEATGEHEVTFTFDQSGNRELPQIVGQLYVLPKHWWEGTNDKGEKRDVTRGTLEPPLGSGPYKIKSLSTGRSVTYERVKDYWAADLPVNRGINNFDEISYDYFRDRTVALEAFKADQFDYNLEASAKEWATSYKFPAVEQGKVKLEMFEDSGSGIMQAFAFNIRREKFADPRVRRAFNLTLDFEEMNRTLFYGQYKRIDSYFFGTELASSGIPQGLEREILETVKDDIPPEVFTKPYTNPTGTGREVMREHLLEARRLLKEAGWDIPDGERVLKNAKGQPLTVEFLLVQPSFERVVLFMKPSLERLGIQVNVRIVDDSQYVNRVRGRDYDVIVTGWAQSLSPGNEQRYFWGSGAADDPGSQNFVGIKNPAVDKLIDRVIYAKNREELVAATRALDRVLLWNHYVVPNWTLNADRTARWDRFGHPDNMPKRGSMFPTIWWYDEAKAAAVGGR
ncbi:ABC transporter substrate-binding protein [Agaricicola taiwanensis]|uniref:ABC transporter substrate-binding protein n=1 Tax=Agaricicola taiwanensis TaxID=591372 RepID=A0A8J2VMX5_9RHOB|nr:extracellular solute-binding protein [Agaricicola taiwanensis]GGE33324.1 ABC transporter substrate-binding protein [Agaricicola taiwanensis]